MLRTFLRCSVHDRRAIIGVTLLACATTAILGCRENSAYYRRLTIGPGLLVELHDPLREPPSHEPHYSPFHAAFLISVDYRAGGERYDALTLGLDNRLTSRSKCHLLRRGEFGSVYTQQTYFYATKYAGQPNQLMTVGYANSVGHDTPDVVSQKPAATCVNLSAVSLVRIFKHPPGYIIASANYSASGELQSLHVNGARNGEWVHANVVDEVSADRFKTATFLQDSPKTREYFGIPRNIPPESLRGPEFAWPPGIVRSHLDSLYLHYDSGHCVNERSFESMKFIGQRWLLFRLTPADQLLLDTDSKRPLGRAIIPYDER